MSDQANIVGKVTTDTTQAVRSVGDLKRAVDAAGSGFSSFAKSSASVLDTLTTGLGKANLALGGVQKIVAVFGEAVNLAKFSAQMAQSERRMSEMGVSVEAMSKAVDGAVKRTDLMSFALKNLQGETALTKDEMLLVLQAADALGDQGFGETMQIAEDLAGVLAGKGTRSLVQYKIAVDNLGEGQERVNNLLRKYKEIAESGVKVDKNLDDVERMTASMGNWWDGVKVAAGDAVTWIAKASNAVDEFDAKMQRAIRSYNNLTQSDYVDASEYGMQGVGRGLAGNPETAAILQQNREAALSAQVNRYASQFETALRNRPAGWYDDLTGDVYLSMKSLGRGVGRKYDKALDRAMNPGEYHASAAEAVAVRQTYGQQFFVDASAATLSSGDGGLSRDIAEYDAAQRRAAAGFDMTEAGLNDQSEKAKELELNEQIAQLDMMAQSSNLAADALWNLGDAFLSGSGSATAFLKDLSKGVSGMGKDAFFKSIYFLAEGWAFPTKRAESFAAAKFYATAAALAIPTAAALNGLAGGGGGGSSGGAHAGSAAAGASIGSSGGDRGGTSIVVNVQGVIGEPAEVGRIINNAIDSARRTGRSRDRGISWT